MTDICLICGERPRDVRRASGAFSSACSTCRMRGRRRPHPPGPTERDWWARLALAPALARGLTTKGRTKNGTHDLACRAANLCADCLVRRPAGNVVPAVEREYARAWRRGGSPGRRERPWGRSGTGSISELRAAEAFVQQDTPVSFPFYRPDLGGLRLLTETVERGPIERLVPAMRGHRRGHGHRWVYQFWKLEQLPTTVTRPALPLSAAPSRDEAAELPPEVLSDVLMRTGNDRRRDPADADMIAFKVETLLTGGRVGAPQIVPDAPPEAMLVEVRAEVGFDASPLMSGVKLNPALRARFAAAVARYQATHGRGARKLLAKAYDCTPQTITNLTREAGGPIYTNPQQ